MGKPKMLIVFALAAAVVIGAIVSLATGSWLFLVIAVAIHFTATGLVFAFVLKETEEGDKPDPATVADVESGDITPEQGRARDER
jgi:membrane protein implicated in regulation of membrane protease activity